MPTWLRLFDSRPLDWVFASPNCAAAQSPIRARQQGCLINGAKPAALVQHTVCLELVSKNKSASLLTLSENTAVCNASAALEVSQAATDSIVAPSSVYGPWCVSGCLSTPLQPLLWCMAFALIRVQDTCLGHSWAATASRLRSVDDAPASMEALASGTSLCPMSCQPFITARTLRLKPGGRPPPEVAAAVSTLSLTLRNCHVGTAAARVFEALSAPAKSEDSTRLTLCKSGYLTGSSLARRPRDPGLGADLL